MGTDPTEAHDHPTAQSPTETVTTLWPTEGGPAHAGTDPTEQPTHRATAATIERNMTATN